ncbi:MAG: hypothetical protein ABI314_01840 [Gemmatimonadaceae bacterium]
MPVEHDYERDWLASFVRSRHMQDVITLLTSYGLRYIVGSCGKHAQRGAASERGDHNRADDST